MKSLFLRLKTIDPNDKKSRLPCFDGWIRNINCLSLLWEEMKNIPGVDYICTRRLNQDGLENQFGVIRQKGGLRDAPEQFRQALGEGGV